MTTETILTDADIFHCFDTWLAESVINFDADELYPVGRAIEQAVLQSVRVSRWIDVSESAPYCEGSYVVRINRHGHLRLGGRVMNPDTLRYQWQVDGEICNTVTHYLPIPALQIAEKNK